MDKHPTILYVSDFGDSHTQSLSVLVISVISTVISVDGLTSILPLYASVISVVSIPFPYLSDFGDFHSDFS